MLIRKDSVSSNWPIEEKEECSASESVVVVEDTQDIGNKLILHDHTTPHPVLPDLNKGSSPLG